MATSPSIRHKSRNTTRQLAQKQGSIRTSRFDKTSGRHHNTGNYRVCLTLARFWNTHTHTHISHTTPGTRPDEYRKHRGRIEHRVLKNIRATPTHMHIQGFVHTGQILENTFSTKLPENGPTASAKQGVKSKIVF